MLRQEVGAVRDEDTPTGWSIEVGSFPGQVTVPEW